MAVNVIGIDPDTQAHGVARYHNGVLVELKNLALFPLLDYIDGLNDVYLSIENVLANEFVYSRNESDKKKVQSKVAMHVGRCQQSQVELMRALDHFHYTYEIHKPQAGN